MKDKRSFSPLRGCIWNSIKLTTRTQSIQNITTKSILYILLSFFFLFLTHRFDSLPSLNIPLIRGEITEYLIQVVQKKTEIMGILNSRGFNAFLWLCIVERISRMTIKHLEKPCIWVDSKWFCRYYGSRRQQSDEAGSWWCLYRCTHFFYPFSSRLLLKTK